MLPADQTIYHDEAHPSVLILPLMAVPLTPAQVSK